MAARQLERLVRPGYQNLPDSGSPTALQKALPESDNCYPVANGIPVNRLIHGHRFRYRLLTIGTVTI